MPITNPIKTPAGYVPAFALGFSGPEGELEIVEATKPLPVAIDAAAPLPVVPQFAGAPTPIEGSSAASALVGPFTPVAGRPVVLSLAGAWEGSVQLTRSTDGGITRHPITVGGFPWGRYTGNACEPVWEEQEEGAQLHLDITLESGAIGYRIAQ
jgi:hypothetical protein